jgi:hypothetical protein
VGFAVKRLLLIPLLAACDGMDDLLDATFVDDVVGAPARSTEVSFLEGGTCDDLLRVPPEEVEQVSSLISRRTAGFPIHPDAKIFEEIPRERPLLIHVVALDSEGFLVGRGCTEDALPAEGPVTIQLELRALPACLTDWRFLDIALVIDTTFDMAAHFPGNEHIDALKNFVSNFEEGTRFSLITHGHTQPPAELLPPTLDRDAVAEAIEALRGLNGGTVALFDGVSTSTRLLRTRAVCPRRPAIVIVEAGRDAAETNIPVTEAKLGLFATTGDSSDDIYVHGVFATEQAKLDLEELVDGLALFGLSSGTTVSVLQQSLLDARFALDGLIVR